MIATLPGVALNCSLHLRGCRGGAGEFVAHGVGSEVGGRSAGVARKFLGSGVLSGKNWWKTMEHPLENWREKKHI